MSNGDFLINEIWSKNDVLESKFISEKAARSLIKGYLLFNVVLFFICLGDFYTARKKPGGSPEILTSWSGGLMQRPKNMTLLGSHRSGDPFHPEELGASRVPLGNAHGSQSMRTQTQARYMLQAGTFMSVISPSSKQRLKLSLWVLWFRISASPCTRKISVTLSNHQRSLWWWRKLCPYSCDHTLLQGHLGKVV